MTSAAATYAAITGVIATDARDVVVTTRNIAPGTRLEADDLRVQKMSVVPNPGSVASSPSQLLGLTALGPIGNGELVQASNVMRKASGTSQPEISFSLPTGRAVGGDLRRGEVVDILATDKTNADGSARLAASSARVVEVRTGNKSVGQSGDVVITVAVEDTNKAASIATAVDTGQVTLVRTTGVEPS